MLHLLHVSPESPTDSECLVLSVKTTNRWVETGDCSQDIHIGNKQKLFKEMLLSLRLRDWPRYD